MAEEWHQSLNSEFQQAETARAAGNEGRARVCARRAAGIAIREYLSRQGQTVQGASSYDLITRLMETPGIPSDVREICIHLSMQVSEEFTLPVEVDLVAESRLLCSLLLPD